MLDLKFIRENPDKVKKGIVTKQFDSKLVDQVLEVDKKLRNLKQEVERSRFKKRQYSEEIIKIAIEIAGNQKRYSEKVIKEAMEMAKERKSGYSPEVIEKAKEELRKNELQLKRIEEELTNLLIQIPNLPAQDVKTGKDETENEVIRKWGEPAKFNFTPKNHVRLGHSLDIIDIERAVKVSGARFTYLKNEAVLLEFALIQLAINILIKEGFTAIIPPVLMKVSVFHKLGYSEHMGNENYYLVLGGDKIKTQGEEEAEYYLVGTAEHSIVPYYKDEILSGKELPKRFVGFSTAFRREAGSYGKDTKGILRVHQFDKVEMVSFTKPEYSDKEHEFLLSLEEKLFQSLNIPYQVVKMCSGDLGAPTARKYDLEAWIPSEGKYREVTSTSTCTDFQARRLNIKYKDGQKTEYLHILNGTVFAIGRTIIAILENYQQKDGSVLIPKVLQPYIGKEVITPKND